MSKYDYFRGGDSDADAFMAKQNSYKSLKNSELDSIPQDELINAVTSWIEGKFAADWSDMCKVINDLPTPCLNIYCADYVSAEILDGGFSQAFFNTSRDFIGAAANGLRAIGMDKAADVVDRALKAHFDSGAKSGGGGIDDFLSFISDDRFTSLDNDFRTAFDKNIYTKLTYDYIIHYKKYFGENND